MRTTIDLPDPLFRKLKAAASQRGISLELLVRKAVEVELRKMPTKAARRLNFPILASKQPGTLNLMNADIEDLLA